MLQGKLLQNEYRKSLRKDAVRELRAQKQAEELKIVHGICSEMERFFDKSFKRYTETRLKASYTNGEDSYESINAFDSKYVNEGNRELIRDILNGSGKSVVQQHLNRFMSGLEMSELWTKCEVSAYISDDAPRKWEMSQVDIHIMINWE